MSYNHGIVTSEQATSLVSAVSADSAAAVVFGTAPINMGNLDNVNKPVLCYSYKEAVEQMGFMDNFAAGFTIPEVIYSQFSLYGVAPIIFVNVLDPDKHKTSKVAADYQIKEGKVYFPEAGILKQSLKINIASSPLEEGTDYSLSFMNDGSLVAKLSESLSASSESIVNAAYSYLDPSKVTPEDIIGGIDPNTFKKTGIELTEEIYPRFRIAPAILAAPGFSKYTAVATAMAAKAATINGLFKAIAIADIAGCDIKDGVREKVENYSQAVEFKNKKSLTSRDLVTAWPKVTFGGKEYWMSTHLIGVMGRTDAQNDQLPYKSPSNEAMNIDGLINEGEEVILTPNEAAYLNGNGIVTALNFIGGFKAWGNRTAAYPGVTDVKDCMIPVRRMFAWANNTIILTYWQKVDYPIRRRTIDSIRDSITYWLNGLTAREIILGGRIVFEEAENPITDIMDGIIRFHLYLTPPTPAREIDFKLEYDPAYLQTLFS